MIALVHHQFAFLTECITRWLNPCLPGMALATGYPTHGFQPDPPTKPTLPAANTGGPRSRIVSTPLISRRLSQGSEELGLSCSRRKWTLQGLTPPFRKLALQLLRKAGFHSPEDAWEAHRDQLPSEACLVIDAVERPDPGAPSGDPLLTALVLGRCSGSLFSPARPIIWSERRLARSIRLVRCQPDAFLDDDLS
ncbi:MAG: hypothetical protein ACK5CW_00345 [Verrucomicrobiota bacterium]